MNLIKELVSHPYALSIAAALSLGAAILAYRAHRSFPYRRQQEMLSDMMKKHG